MYGDPVLVRPRLGQGAFQLLVTDTYERHCAVTGERALPTLDAAHIRAVQEGGQHRIDNGLLLRTDIHRLFDRGYVTVTPDHRFRVSRRLKTDFDNGEPYYPLEGREIWVPRRGRRGSFWSGTRRACFGGERRARDLGTHPGPYRQLGIGAEVPAVGRDDRGGGAAPGPVSVQGVKRHSTTVGAGCRGRPEAIRYPPGAESGEFREP